MVAQMFPMAVSVSLTVRLGMALASGQHAAKRSKQLVVVCMSVSSIFFGLLSFVFYISRRSIYAIFTHEQGVIDGCEQIWGIVCLLFFVLCIFILTTGVATALGMQWLQGLSTVVWLWMIGIPATYYFGVAKHGGLVVAWWWYLPPYIGISGNLLITFYRKDWDEIVDYIRLREAAINEASAGELESLLLTAEVIDKHYEATS